jgi:membrane associated rhomboid family serine protease
MLENLPPVVKNLVIINGIIFIFLFWVSSQPNMISLMEYFLLFKSDVLIGRGGYSGLFQPLQIVTHFFSHQGIFHIAFNMMALVSLGTGVEYVFGSRRFLEFYLFCGVVGGLIIAFFDPSPSPVLGASGAISGVIVAFAFFFPHEKLSVFFLPPIESRWVAIAIGVISLLLVVFQVGGQISHFGHLAGMIAALMYFGIYKLKALL